MPITCRSVDLFYTYYLKLKMMCDPRRFCVRFDGVEEGVLSECEYNIKILKTLKNHNKHSLNG